MDRLCYAMTRYLPPAFWVGRGRMWIATRAWRYSRLLEWREAAKAVAAS